MKRMILVLIMVFMTNTACALMLGWDQHTDTAVQGYLLQWEETNSPPETFSINVGDIGIVQMEIADNFFKPDIEYSIWVRAYNGIGDSVKSNIIQFIRSTYLPPADNIPAETYDAPNAVINFTNQ